VHGREFIDAAIAQGAVAVAVETEDEAEQFDQLRQIEDALVFNVSELSQKAGFIADCFFEQPSKSMQVVGVTGTNGKTSCTRFITESLNQLNHRVGVIGTLGSGLWPDLTMTGFTTPQAVELQHTLAQFKQTEVNDVVMEVSSHALHQGRANAIAFDIAVLTNLSRDHLDYHGDMQSYREAKEKLFQNKNLRAAVINLDDAMGQHLAVWLPSKMRVLGYSLKSNTHANIEFLHGAISAKSNKGFNLAVECEGEATTIAVPLLGTFNAQNVLATIGVLLLNETPLEQIKNCIEKLKAPEGRMEQFGGEGDLPLVVVDYAHTPDALEQVLMTLREHCEGLLWVVFGCGGDRDRGKRAPMGEAAERIADVVVITNDNPRSESADAIVADILQGLQQRERAIVKTDRAEAIRHAMTQAQAMDIVLVAGKGHEDYQIINSERLHFSDRECVRDIMDELRSAA
jgi:UDP-N-acetylmuramoyl-L-alanyl-D-glutamate--2,6-diaminopimelate ligase